jgi:hypothetical protein
MAADLTIYVSLAVSIEHGSLRRQSVTAHHETPSRSLNFLKRRSLAANGQLS